MKTDNNYMFFYIFIWVASTLLLQYIFKKPTKPRAPLCLPPSPPALPIIGHLHYLSPKFHKSLHNLSSKYGPLLYLQLPSYPLVLVSSAPMAAEIFKTHDVEFADKPRSVLEDRILFVASYGDYWRFMKKLCMTELLGQRQLERSQNVRREEITQFLHKLMEKAQNNEVVNLGVELLKLTINCLCRVAMSTRCSGEGNEAERCREPVMGFIELARKTALANILGPLKRLGFWAIEKQASDIERRLNEFFEKLWTEHEERAERDGGKREVKDLMDILLEVYEDENAEIKLSRTHVKSFLVDIFVAGTGSSDDIMQWIMAELFNHPSIFKKLGEELKLVVGNNRLV